MPIRLFECLGKLKQSVVRVNVSRSDLVEMLHAGVLPFVTLYAISRAAEKSASSDVGSS